jgi:hypothetical protein
MADNINIHPKETVCGGEDWIQPDQDKIQWQALVNTVIKTFGFHTRRTLIS